MKRAFFETLAPVCPRCRAETGALSPLTLSTVADERAGLVWQGILSCSASTCQQEYPIIDGIPIIVPDPSQFLANMHHQIIERADFKAPLAGLLGDAFGPGSTYDQTRQHLSIYAGAHFSDWSEPQGDAGLTDVLPSVFAMMDEDGQAPVIDLGCGVGRSTWALSQRRGALVLGADLNLSMLRLAQRLLLEGEAHWDRRRIGLVYDPVTVRLPEAYAEANVDFWAVDAMALPFRDAAFGAAMAINLVDCIPGPTNLIAETARVLQTGASAVLTTPYDWAGNVAEPMAWIGGHSQRGMTNGAGEPVLLETLRQYGLTPEATLDDVPWRLRLHARAVMHYSLHVVGCRRA